MPQDFWGRIIMIMSRYGASFARGMSLTIVIALIGTFFGCVIGLALGIIQTIPELKGHKYHNGFLKAAKFVIAAYMEIFRGTPMMVQAMFIYYGAAVLFGIHMTTMFAALFIVSINTGAYMIETVRGGIQSIDPGQVEGAKAIGMTHTQAMLYVILPQAIRDIMPQIGNNLIINIKDTSVLNVIGVVELFYTTNTVAGAYYTYFEAFSIAMVLYFVMTFSCSRILRVLERRMDGPQNYTIADKEQIRQAVGVEQIAAGER